MISSRLFSHSSRLLNHTLHRAFSCTSPVRSKTCDPLRILFCGSDDFSIASLQALNQTRIQKPEAGIDTIDVVCRPGKRTGRGRKVVTHPPIRDVAHELELEVYEIDTFTGWTPPRGINLIVAVSFGLLVPPRILGLAKYGGLNVHPSLLPDFRGAAPLQHTLLQRRTHTGVSVQTLHPTRFDRGEILAQTPLPGVRIANVTSTKYLENSLAPLGAALLEQTIRERKFVEPIQSIRHSQAEMAMITNSESGVLSPAPKVRSEDRRISWSGMSNEDILLRDGVLGPLYDDIIYRSLTGKRQRITFEQWSTTCADESCAWADLGNGHLIGIPLRYVDDTGQYREVWNRPAQFMRLDRTLPESSDRRRIYCQSMTIEGKPKGAAGMWFTEWLRKRGVFAGKHIKPGEHIQVSSAASSEPF